MKFASVLTTALVILITFPRSEERKSKNTTFCEGEDGNRYEKGEGYEDKKVCIRYSCTRRRHKLKMKKEKMSCFENVILDKYPIKLTPQKQNKHFNKYDSLSRKEGESFVLKMTWCFWLGCDSVRYYKPCCTRWQPYCPGLKCKGKQNHCNQGWALVGSRCYRIVNAGTFGQAKAFCEDDRGSVVEINSQIEQDILSKFYKDSNLRGWVWLGAKKTQDEEWWWIYSEERLTFNSWKSGEPNNDEGNQNCVIWDGNQLWRAVRCDYTDANFKAICEERKERKEDEPADLEPITANHEPEKTCNCGIPNRTLRIVGGTTAEKNEYPWQVALVRAYDTVPFCSGSLISQQTVLTAAHCTERLETEDISVLIGAHNVRVETEGQERKKVRKIIQNNLYNFETKDYDISLLILKNPVRWNKKVKPICLPRQSINYENLKGIVSGWGTLEYNGLTSDTLLETEVMTMTNTECTTNKRYDSSEITSSMICAAAYGRDACQGDSGGPLITLEEGTYYSVIGVVSWGKGCGHQDYAGVYSRVANQMSWIQTNMAGQTCLTPKPTLSNPDMSSTNDKTTITTTIPTITTPTNIIVSGGDLGSSTKSSDVISSEGVCSQGIPPLTYGFQQLTDSVFFNNSIWICGGYPVTVHGFHGTKKRCQILKTGASQWTQGPLLNVERHFHTVTKAGDELIATGGISGSSWAVSSMEKLSLASGKWTVMSETMPTTRSNHATVYFPKTKSLILTGGIPSTKKTESFNVASGQWTDLDPLPVELKQHGSITMGNSILVAGGFASGGGRAQKKVYRLNIINGGTWETVGELTKPRYRFTMGFVDRQLVVVGGDDDVNRLDSIEYMDKTGVWKEWKFSLSSPRTLHAMATVPAEAFPC